MTPGTLVVVRWGEAQQPALARVVSVKGDRVRVEKWKPAAKWNEPARDWSLPKTIAASDVLREADHRDRLHFGYTGAAA